MKFSKGFGNSYDFFMQFIERPYLRKRRSKLISGLSGKILEVGIGTGVNFEHYGTEVQLIGIEPSPYMIEQARTKKDISIAAGKITLHHLGCGDQEMERMIEPCTLDFVVCTLVLCTIPDPEKAIRNFMRWLKPGGKLIILEHIRSQNRLVSKMQDMLNPAWQKVGEGCQINRATDKLIPAMGFNLIEEEYFRIAIPFYQAVYEKPLGMTSGPS